MESANAIEDKGDYQLVYSRYEDGSLPVRVYPDKRVYEIYDPAMVTCVERHTSVRGLLTRLQGRDRHWSFDRYFMQGKWSRDACVGNTLSVLDLFSGRSAGETAVSVAGTVGVPRGVTASSAITIAGPVEKVTPLDLSTRHHEIAKLLFKQFGRMIRNAGWDEDDVLQEVYMGLLSRNRPGMRSMWNPEKAGFGTYVVLVCRSILSNYRRKMDRVGRLRVGMKDYKDGVYCDVDVASTSQTSALWQDAVQTDVDHTAPARLLRFLEDQILDPIASMLALLVTPLLVEGRSSREIQHSTGLRRREIKETREVIEYYSTLWHQQGCP